MLPKVQKFGELRVGARVFNTLKISKMKKIEVSNETKRDAAKAFGCTQRAVRNALNYSTNSVLAKKIRKYAVEKGGMAVKQVPDCETVFEAGHMVQTFTNGVIIDCDLGANTMVVKREGDGIVLHKYEDVTIPMLMEVQASVERMPRTISFC